MSKSFRQSMAGLHTWSGLLLGWLLFAIVLTGTATVFRSELAAWMRPEVTASADPAEAIVAAVEYLEHAEPGLAYWSLTAPDERTDTVQAVFADPDAPKGYADIALDPVTGSPDAMRETLGGEFFYRFHFELQMPYPWGRLLASAAAMLMLVALVSGIITHRRIFSDYFTLRTGKGKRSWLDAHLVLGVLALPFHLMITATGIFTLITLTMPWAGTAAYGDDLAAMSAEVMPGLISRPATGEAAPLGDVAAMLAEAEARFDGGRIGRVGIANPGDSAAIVTVTRHDGDQLAYAASNVSFDGVTGEVLGSYSEVRPAKTTFDVLYGLHMGRFAPEFSRWLYFLCGVALAAVIATGLVIWTEGRRHQGGVGHAFVSRLNVGTVMGLPLAMLGHLYANRLLPFGMDGRIEAEVASFFWIWAASLLYGAVRPPRAGWTELAWLNAAAAAALPIVSFALTGRGLWQAVAAGDWTFAGFDAVMILCAALFVAAAMHLSRTPQEPRRTARVLAA